jgi:SAM-dependent methyltransferase
MTYIINFLLKTIRYLRYYSFKKIFYLYQTRIRKCKCCNKISLIISLDKGEETKRCIFCMANLRYEMLAEYIHKNYDSNIRNINILELDFNSPLKRLFENANEYVMTYYSSKDKLGSLKNGIRCEDITQLSFTNNKFDLIISSDVLEHVCDLNQAFKESVRVLKPNGVHVFTIPYNEGKTFKRCEWVNGNLVHFSVPEYHYDPLDKNGCLVYWSFGSDISEFFKDNNFTISIIKGPIGQDKRYLFALKKNNL